jgi:TonB family protein
MLQVGVVAAAFGGLTVSAQTLRPVAANVSPSPIVLPAAGVRPPKLIHHEGPLDPAHEKHEDTTVVVGYVVGVDGHTHQIHVLKSKGQEYDFNAMLAIAKCLYRPAMENGVPVAVVMTRKVNFVYPEGFWDPHIPVMPIQ